jgi:hypothetical protein
MAIVSHGIQASESLPFLYASGDANGVAEAARTGRRALSKEKIIWQH